MLYHFSSFDLMCAFVIIQNLLRDLNLQILVPVISDKSCKNGPDLVQF